MKQSAAAKSAKPAPAPHHEHRRKPWAEKYQTATAVGGFCLIVAIVIVAIGWNDGYWSSSSASSAAVSKKGKGP